MNKTMMSVVELSMQMWGPRKAPHVVSEKPLLLGERTSCETIRE